MLDQDFRRLPGLYRLWDLQALLRKGRDYRIEDAGLTDDGTPLLAVWEAMPAKGEDLS